jgi:hypothetical protein
MNPYRLRKAAGLALVCGLLTSVQVTASVTDITNASPNPITVGQETEFSVDVDASITSIPWESTRIFVDGQPYICVPQPDPGYGQGAGDVSATITVPVTAPLDQPGTYAISAEDYGGLNCDETGLSAEVSTPLTVVAPPDRATFEVSKDFTDDNPAGVEVTISCNTGLPLEQSKVITEGAGVEFVVTDFDSGEMDCEITEQVLVGYEVVYDNIDTQTQNDIGCAYENVPHGSAFTCAIINTPGPVDVVIHKEWVFEGSSQPQGVDQRYDLTLWCDAEIVDGEFIGDAQEAPSGIIGPFCGVIDFPTQEGGQLIQISDWCKSFSGEGPDSFTAEVIPEFPDSHCFVIERLFDDAVEVDNDCQDITVSAGNGAACTITNTVFFEGIPTLNQYGVALLALLMLGVGFIGFRRLA